MRKVSLVLLTALLAFGVLFLGCPTDPPDAADDGSLKGNWFDVADFGIVDFNASKSAYDWGSAAIGNLPSVETWNSRGDNWNIPDPFFKLNGTRVANGGTTAAQSAWLANGGRRDEIKDVIEYYMLGKSPAANARTFDWSEVSYTIDEVKWGDWVISPETYVKTGLRLTFDKPAGGTTKLDLAVFIPQHQYPYWDKDHNDVATNTGANGPYTANPTYSTKTNITYPVPVLFYMAMGANYSFAEDMLNAGYALVSVLTSDVYGETTGGNNSWENVGTGLIGDLFPTEMAQQQTNPEVPTEQVGIAWAVGRVIDALAGIGSKTGKPAAFDGKINVNKIGITGMSRWGKIALVVGAYEPRIAVTIPEHAGGLGVSIERWSATTTAKGTFYLDVANDPTNVNTLNASPNGKIISAKLVDGLVFEPDTYAGKYRFGLDNPNGANYYNNNFQGWTQGWQEQMGWTNSNFKKFQASATWTQDRETGNKTGAHVVTAPFDMHFLTALIAPRGLLIYAGTKDFWNNPSGEFAGYRLTDEVYKYLGVPENLGNRVLNIQHTSLRERAVDQIRFMDKYLGPTGSPALAAATEKAYFKADKYPLDPRDYKDNIKFNWVYPGSTEQTFAAKTKAAFDSGNYASHTGD